MKKSLSNIFTGILFLLSTSVLSAEINLLSPVKGNWANKQMLIIENAGEGEYFYSVDGSDPASFGFAYDGPVLLDVEGNIKLKVTKLLSRNKKEYVEVDFNVDCDEATSKDYGKFISSFYDSGILNYTSGSELNIPESLYYSFGLPPNSFIKGRSLVLSEKSALTRYIPCTVQDKNNSRNWRFIVKTFPLSAGTFSRRDLPFKITDWDTIEFTDDNLIYKVDSEYWGLPKEPRKIDRSVSHMISYQSISYEFGNPVEFYVLPPKPELITEEGEDGEIIYTLKGDSSYRMSIISEDSSYQELFTELGADVFYGDRVKGALNIGVYASGLYQGNFVAEYNINKRPPSSPYISSDSQSFYTRKDVSLSIEGDAGSQMYYAVSEPLPVDNSSYKLQPDAQMFTDCKAENFVKADSSKVELNFTGLKDSGVYYKVRAYSVTAGNTSEITEYSFIIDQYNYYFNSKAETGLCDGTIEHPFNNVKDLFTELNKSRNVSLRISGQMFIPEGKYEITSNCQISGYEDGAQILFDAGSQLIVKDSTFEIKGLEIKNIKKESKPAIIPFIKGERSILIVNDCLIYGDFSKNGTIIDAYKSFVYVDHSICAVNASTYASFIAGVSSKINIKNSNINTNSDTSVLISVSEGKVNCSNSSLKVSGKTGRIAELFNVTGTFEKNIFKGELSKITQSLVPVYCDPKTKVELKGNENYGF